MKILKVNVDGHHFDGFKFKGTPVSTIIRGKIKMKDGKILGEPEGEPLKFN
jgi:dihydroorotase